MKKFFAKIMFFWDEDRSLTTMLLLLLLFIFVLVPILNQGRTGVIFIKITYSVILLTGILSVAKHRNYVILAGIFAIIGFLINWLSDIEPTMFLLIANDFGAILFNAFLQSPF